MHYSVAVVTHEQPTDELIKQIMAPYGDGKEWDWYQIGGRWTGLFSGYKPEEDPDNIETCFVCAGTGIRPNGLEEFGQAWFDSMNGCNGCKGKGKKEKWPTSWKRHDGDQIHIDKVTEEQMEKFYAICVQDYGWFSSERYQPWLKDEKFVKQELPSLEWLKDNGAYITVVDCHN